MRKIDHNFENTSNTCGAIGTKTAWFALLIYTEAELYHASIPTIPPT